jgi:inner membrane protein
MDPVTHCLFGATLARTGFNRKAAYATLAMTLAAEAPDSDIAWGIRGPVAGFLHHRGITHTFVGLPLEAAVVLGVVYGIHRIRLRRALAQPRPAPPLDPTADRLIPPPLTCAPIRWPLLYALILLALLSHLFLDWTNSYGIRPFFPFNPRWYQLSTVFIIEPLILLFLIAALLAPLLFGLTAGEVGARRKPFRGRGWALAALLAICALWGLRQVEHDDAIDLATAAPYGPAGAPIPADQVLRVTASPSPINPFVWHTVAETPGFFQLATVNTLRHLVDTDPAQDLLYKPPTTIQTLIAKRSPLGQAYLDWSSWPLVTDQGPTPLPTDESSTATPITAVAPRTVDEVLFRDLRFLYDTTGRSGRENPPLSGQVYIDLTQPEPQRIVATYLNNKPQR